MNNAPWQDNLPTQDNTCAVIVTHHPDAGFPQRVQTILPQVALIVIVDNCSNGDARRMLTTLTADPKVALIENPENAGVARALNQGAEYALGRGCAWALTFDQDTASNPDLAATLIEIMRSHPQRDVVKLIGSNYLAEPTGEQAFRGAPDGADAAEVPAVITSGSLMSLAAFAEVGGFREDLFIDYVDAEYCLRLRARGYRVLISCRPLMRHALGQLTLHPVPWKTLKTSNHSPLRRYYITRNRLVVDARYFLKEPRWVCKDLRRALDDIAVILLLERQKGLKLRAMALGTWHALTGRMGRLVNPRLEQSATESASGGAPPMISVALCTFNGARFLPEQLESLLQQARRPDELVVGDDGSTDGTLSLCREFAARAPFPVRIETASPRRGPARNFADTARQCRGDLIAFCDQDDRWLPEKLAALEDALLTHPESALAFSDALLLGPEGRPTRTRLWSRAHFRPPTPRDDPDALLRSLLRQPAVTGATMMFRADLNAVLSRIPDGWMHDEWLALSAAASGRPCICISQGLMYYRVHEAQALGLSPGFLQRAVRRLADEGGALQSGAARWRAAAQILSGQAEIRAESLALIQGKAIHLEQRSRLLERPRLQRLPVLVEPRRLADYARFSFGLASVLHDLLAARPC